MRHAWLGVMQDFLLTLNFGHSGGEGEEVMCDSEGGRGGNVSGRNLSFRRGSKWCEV